jgi:hypothetical protein
MPDSILGRTYALPSGPRVRLRLARPADARAVAALLAGRGVEAGDIEIRRLLAFDPSRRAVICAFAPLDGAETLVGVGGIDLHEDAAPDTVIVDERLTDGLGVLLGEVLARRARAHARRVA